MNRFRLIDEVSIYLHDRNNCQITLFFDLKDVCTFYRDVWSRPLPMQNCQTPQNCHMMIILGWGKLVLTKLKVFYFLCFSFPPLAYQAIMQIIQFCCSHNNLSPFWSQTPPI